MHLWLLGYLVLISGLTASKTNPLKGKHLRIYFREFPMAVSIKYNASGYPVQLSGQYVDSINSLAKLLGFTYTPVNLENRPIDSTTPDQPGSLSYLENQEVDMIVSAIVVNEKRNKKVDFLFPMIFSSYRLLIPFPEHQANLSAPIEPFSNKVWALVVLSIVAVILAIYYLSSISKQIEAKNDPSGYIKLDSSAEYVTAVLMSQGGYYRSRRVKVRIVAGVWCLAAFVLVYSYSSVLTSFLTAPNLKPFINSIYDVPEKKGLAVMVQQNSRTVLTDATSERLKLIYDSWVKNPALVCVKASDCLEEVSSGHRTFLQAHELLLNLILQDSKNHGRCRFTLAKEPFLFATVAMALPKNSPYREAINKGIIQLWESGFIGKNLWTGLDYFHLRQCLDYKTQKTKTPRLTLSHLSGILVILVIGFGLAFIAFVSETIVRKIMSHKTTTLVKANPSNSNQ